MRNALEDHFQGSLHDARIECRCYAAETPTVDISPRVSELRMIEYVEGLKPELQTRALGDLRILEQRHVVVIDAGSGEEAAARSAKLTEGIEREVTRVEVG